MTEILEKIYRFIYFKTGVFDNILFSLPIVLAVVLVYWFVRRAVQRRRLGEKFKEMRRRTRVNEIIRLLLVTWIAETVCATLTPSYFWDFVWQRAIYADEFTAELRFFELQTPDLTPTVIDYLAEGHLNWLFSARFIWIEFAVNIALFIPPGLLIPFICKRISLPKTALIGLSCTFLIEFLQCFISNRDSTMDDIICNTIGAVIGYLMYLLIKKLFPKFTEKARMSACNRL